MKNVLRVAATLFSVLTMIGTAFGQQYYVTASPLDAGNPGSLRTSTDNSSSGSIMVLDNDSLGGNSVNSWSRVQTIPFAFEAFGSPVTQYVVSKNGLVSFDVSLAGTPVAASLNSNSTLPHVDLPNNSVAVFWDDFTGIATGDNVYSYTYGTSPNQQHWIQYFSYSHALSSFEYFALVLEEGTNKMYVVDMYGSGGANISATVGYQVNTTTAFMATVPLNGTLGSPNIEMGSNGTSLSDNEYYELLYVPAGGCVPDVSTLAVDSISATMAEVSWSSNTGTSFVVEYGLAGFALGTGDLDTVTTTSAVLTGLLPATYYDFYVYNDCGTSLSNPVGPASFITGCVLITTFPFTENFDNLPWVSSTTTTSSGGLAHGDTHPCWSRSSSSTSTTSKTHWFVRATSPSSTTGPDVDYSGSGQYVQIETSSGSTDDKGYLEMPAFDFTGMDPELTFYYHMYGTTVNRLVIEASIDGGATWVGVDSIVGEQQTDDLDPWLPYYVDLLPYATDSTLIRFTGVRGTSTTGDIAVDEVTVANKPLCRRIEDISVNFTSATTADITWTGNASSYNILWGPAGFTTASGVSTVSTNTASLTGLPPYSLMEVKIFGDCSSVGNGFSDTASITFITPVQPNWLMTFDAVTGDLPLDFHSLKGIFTDSTVFTETNTSWLLDDYGNNTSATRSIKINIYSSSVRSAEWFVSPSIDLGVGTDYNFEYDIAWTEYNNTLDAVVGSDDTVHVVISTDNGVTWSRSNILRTYHAGNAINAAGTHDVIDLTGYNGLVRLGFFATSTVSNEDTDFFIDNIQVIEKPACATPFAFTVIALSEDSVTFSFEGDSSAAAFDIEWGPCGFAQGTNPANLTSSNNDTVIMGGLNALTCYDVYIRSNCGAVNGSWGGPFSFTTTCPAVFVAPYKEEFENIVTYGAAPASTLAFENCWTTDRSSTPRWETEDASGANENSSNTGPHYDHTDFGTAGGGYIYLEYSSSAPEANLYTPMIDLSALTTPTLAFFYHMYGADMGELHVDVWDGQQWHLNLMSIIGQQQTAGSDPWIRADVPLSSFVGDTIQVRFRGIVGVDFEQDISLDDITINNGSTCSSISGSNADNITSGTADIEWNAYGTSFDLEYGVCGFTAGSGTTISAISGTTQSLTGLAANTCYEYYITNTCNPTVVFGPFSFQTMCSVQMSGTYTVGGPAGPNNFSTLDSAVMALECGVSGPVLFQIYGVHNTSLILSEAIVGSSDINTVTFAGVNPGRVDGITADSSQAAVILSNTGNIVFRNLTLNAGSADYVVHISEMSNNITIDDCSSLGNLTSTSSNYANIVASGSVGSATTAGQNVNHINVMNSHIEGGYYGVVIYGSSSTSHLSGVNIVNNVFDKQYYYPLYVYYMDSVNIIGNTISGQRNSLAYGMRLYYLDALTVEENFVSATDYYGMYLYYIGSTNLPNGNRVVNNMVNSIDDAFYLTNPENLSMYHNSGYSEDGYGIYVSGVVTGTDIRNNIFTSAGDYAFYSTSTNVTGTTLDYNVYYTTSTSFARFGGTADVFANLAAWQTAQSGYNTNSKEGNPVYMATDNLHVFGALANNSAAVIASVTADIDGEPRSTTTPDIGADEYLPVAGDMTLLGADFIQGPCLSANDSISIDVKNLIGPPVDFSIDSLMIHYTVTGPANTSGTHVVNSGILASLDTMEVFIGGIDLSLQGTYVLNAYIDTNAVNTLTMGDTINPAVDYEVVEEFILDPQSYVITSAQDSVNLCVQTNFFTGGSGFFMTEIAHYKVASGAPTAGWPSYLTADDYIEITGVPGSDLGGITLEQWNTTSLMNSYTFPSGTVLSPDGTAIIAVGQPAGSVPSPANFYYHGDVSTTFSSGGNNGRILKDASGVIIDAVGVGSTYTFPATSGVTAADWSGTSGSHSAMSGVRLTGPDLNDASNWVLSNVIPQDPNTVNSGVPVPAATGTTGLTWYLNGVPTADTTACITVGPFTTGGGTYTYVATYTNVCGVYSDTSVITVNSCLMPLNLSANSVTGTSAVLTWDTIQGNSNNNFQVSYGLEILSPNDMGSTKAFTSTNVYSASYAGGGDVCFYVREVCAPGDTSTWAGPYCFATPCGPYKIAPYFDNFESVAAGQSSNAALENCWNLVGGSAIPRWETEDATGANENSLGTGPFYDHTQFGVSGGKYLYLETSGGSLGDTSSAISPWIDASALNTAQVDFWYHMFGGDMGNLYLEARDNSSATWTRFDSIVGQQQVAGSDPWLMRSVILNGLGDTIQIRFVGARGNDFESDMSIDDISIVEAPSCPEINSVSFANATTTGADASWTATVTGQTYEIEYGNFGFARGSGTTVTASAPNYTFSGLAQNNLVKEMYIRPICGPADTGVWTGPFEIETLPELCDDFEAYSAGLVDQQSVLINGWLGAGGDAEVVNFAGSQALHIYDSGPNAFSDVVVELPVIDSGYWKVQFDFQLASGSFGGYYNILHSYGGTNFWAIEVLLDDNGTATVDTGSAGSGSGTLGTYSFNPTGWNTVIHHIDLDNDTAWIEINGVAQTWGWNFSLDDITYGGQFSAVNFYSTAPTGQTPNYYADNFCVTRVCNEPLPTLNITDIHLSVNDTLAVLEFNAHSTDADSIRWDFRNGMSESGEVVTGDFTINGSDSVTVTAYNACGDSVVVTYAFVVEGISLSEFELDNAVNIFPNPSTGIFNLEFERDRSAETGLVILNMLGQVVQEISLGHVASFKGELNLSNMPKGVYILQLRAGDETATRRLTVY